MTNQIDVLVVGAGPVGLFCANELIRHGLNCRIVDKKSGLSVKSKALGIHIRTLDVFADCGFLDEVLAQGHQVKGVIFKSKGKELIHASFEDIEASRHYLIDLPQNKTETILYQELQKKGLDVEWNTELADFSQAEEKIKAIVKKADEKTETIEADWLIACDGAHSTIRKQTKADFKGAEYNKNWWLADLFIDWDVPGDYMAIYVSEKGPLACFPMGNKRYRLVMTAPEGATKDPSMEDMKKAFEERCSDKAKLSDPIWLSQFFIHHRQIEQYRHNRIFFAGDAAHIHSPMGGQGLNTGIQDIYNLVWKLALVQKKQANPKLLDSYQIERHPVGENVLKKTDVMTRMILLKNSFAVSLRNYIAKMLLSFKPVKRIFMKDMAELTISYAKSPIVTENGRISTIKAGTYCPELLFIEPATRASISSFDILKGTKHHLLLFSGLNQKPEPLIELATKLTHRYPEVLTTHLILSQPGDEKGWPGPIWHDEGQKVHKKLALNDPALIFIRPDKYVGLIQNPVKEKELFNYLENWLSANH